MNLPIVYVKNLPREVSSISLFNLFEQYGEIHQIRINSSTNSAFVIFKTLVLAKEALAVSGINFQGRYLVATMYQVKHDEVDILNDEEMKLLSTYVNK